MARVQTPVGERSRTKQSFKEESDLNSVMRKYRSTGALVHNVNAALGRYGDFSSADDYLSAMSRVREAEELFAALPSAIRDHVNNDPGEFLQMVFDLDRRDELVELGLLPPEERAILSGAAKEAATHGGDEDNRGAGGDAEGAGAARDEGGAAGSGRRSDDGHGDRDARGRGRSGGGGAGGGSRR